MSAGDDIFYLAVVRFYSCKDMKNGPIYYKEFLEFWRINPAFQGGGRQTLLNVQELPPPVMGRSDNMNGTTNHMRVGEIFSMVASRKNNGEDVLIGAFSKRLFTELTNGEDSRQEIMVVRIQDARWCVNCGLSSPVEADRSPQSQNRTMPPRRGYYEFQPALFAGGTDGPRVGLAYYVQPFNGLAPGMAVPDIRSTLVEAVVSTDAGESFSRPFSVMAPAVNEPTNAAGGFPQLFFPCPAPNGYAGDYISGVFQEADPMSKSVTIAWTDSRKGCADQGDPAGLTHQHVYVGSGKP